MKISIDCKGIDELLDGGFQSRMLNLVYGERGIGKTWLAVQLAFKTACIDKLNVLYVDTENQMVDEVIARFYEFFKNRWNIKEDLEQVKEKLNFMLIDNIFDLCRLSGFILQIVKGESKTMPRIKFPTKFGDARSDKPDLKESIQTSEWIEKSPLYNLIKEKNYKLIIIDSWTYPVKQVIESEEQNYSGRRSLETPLFSSWNSISNKTDTVFLIIGHGISFRESITPIPWGGSEVMGTFKVHLAITRLRKQEKEAFSKYLEVNTEELRNIFLTRHIYKKDLMPKTVWLKYNYGYTDLPILDKKVKL